MTNKPLPSIPQYRACFGTDAGRFVLADMLKHSGYFDDDLGAMLTPVNGKSRLVYDEKQAISEIAVRNFMQTILKNMGVVTNPENIPEFVNAILNLKVE